MSTQTPPHIGGPLVCRIPSAAIHIQRYSFRGLSLLARDANVSHSSLSRLVNGKCEPSYRLVIQLTEAIEHELGFHIDPRDLVAVNGRFLTPYICELMRCRGCLPEEALDEFGDRTEPFRGITPGQWVSTQHPRGYPRRKEAHGN